jgi:tellurite resistance protein TerC
MSAVWVSFALVFYAILRIWGDELHNIDNWEQLVAVTERHLHNITLIPGDFESSLALYKKNLALEYITGYVVEYALSVDNIFVMVLVFSSFGVKPEYYHKVLVWGIIGAVLLRFLFGLFLVYTGIMMFVNRNQEDEIDPQNHAVVKFASKYFSVYPTFVDGKFFHKDNGKKYITPLFLVLLVIEFTDVIFAVDSIPAIFAVTKDPYIVFFSNIFAILGLRSMFFLLVNIIHKFHYLKVGLSFLLVFIGAKMLLHSWLTAWGFTTSHSLIIILGILVISVVASLIFPKKEENYS